MKRGLLLFAHGARDARWALPFKDVAERIRAHAPEAVVELAFLDFMTPDIAQAGLGLAQAGCSCVDVVPLFLGAGGHVRSDVPQRLAQLRTDHPAVRWRLRPAIGEMPAVIEAMAQTSLTFLTDESDS